MWNNFNRLSFYCIETFSFDLAEILIETDKVGISPTLHWPDFSLGNSKLWSMNQSRVRWQKTHCDSYHTCAHSTCLLSMGLPPCAFMRPRYEISVWLYNQLNVFIKGNHLNNEIYISHRNIQSISGWKSGNILVATWHPFLLAVFVHLVGFTYFCLTCTHCYVVSQLGPVLLDLHCSVILLSDLRFITKTRWKILLKSN